jgi:hypothetical protein
MKKSFLARRNFLRAATGAALVLPFLETTRARSAPGGMPKRFVILQTGEGNLMPRFRPQTLPNDALVLSEMLAPLAGLEDQLLVLSGVANRLPALHTSNGHNAPGHTLLSAERVDTTGTGQFDAGIEVSASMRCLGPSIDHYLANRLGAIEPLNLAVGGSDPGENRMFYRMKSDGQPGANPEAPLEADPIAAFQTNLAGLPEGPATTRADRFRARRASVLDGVVESFSALKKNVSTADRHRLEDHADALRDLEAKLTYVPPIECGGITQEVPGGFSTPGWPEYAQMDVQADLMVDIMVHTLACGARQVVTLQDTQYDGPHFEFLPEGPFEGWHAQVHNDPGLGLGYASASDNPSLRAGFLHYARIYRKLLDKMHAIVEPDGRTLLENSVVLWISEFGDGASHSPEDLPIVLAGGAQGRIPMGRHLTRPGATTADLYTSLLQAFDVDATSFGFEADGLQNGPIPGLVVPG